MIRHLFCIAIALGGYAGLQAQIGVHAAYTSSMADEWNHVAKAGEATSFELPGTGWTAGIDYWFRLKKLRIEFLPTLAFSHLQADAATATTDFSTVLNGLHFSWNTNIYLFDLKGDCDCPTFSKEGPSLHKGFFVQIAPGISYLDFNINDPSGDIASSDTAFHLGIGTGVDIGLSDFLTITPQVGARYYPTATWTGLGAYHSALSSGIMDESPLWLFNAGLRIGFRW
ncbi:MAG: hypothetical protein R2795_17980 [Saprospiraceae bacterium]